MSRVDAPPLLAEEQATAAAHAAGVTVRTVTDLDELIAVEALYEKIWRSDHTPPIGTEMLRALSKAGNYVGCAYAEGVMVGACVGFFAAPADRTLHSHIAGVLPHPARHGVGYALKLHQRAWALQRGVATIEWTFDPLVARNAYFNLVKLAGRPTEYLPNFYGEIRDQINAGDDTDRLVLRWVLQDPDVVAACSTGRQPTTVAQLDRADLGVALGRGPAGEPVIGPANGRSLLVAVPTDVEGMRLTDPALATRWRYAVRKTLGDLIADGARARSFTRDGWYVFDTADQLNHSRGESSS